MSKIIFHPYIGPRYHGAVVRLVILGESHYGEPSTEPSDSTREVVEKWRSGLWAIRYLTIAAQILTGKPAWQIDRRTALDGIAFYNFVQTSMAEISVRPTTAQALESWAAFRDMLSDCNPTHMIATGQSFLWRNMPASDRGVTTRDLFGELLPWREYATPDGFASTIALPHLSRASAPRWHKPVEAFLST